MKKIIIDCDPGHDDVIAILTAYAHPESIDILGITTVAGNQTLDKVTDNILKVEDYCQMDIPVIKGYDKPLIRASEPQPLAHGESGLDGFIFPDTNKKASDTHAILFMKQMLEEHDHVTLVALAPLTNIAVFLKTFPELKKHIDEIVLMGGGISYGNIQTMAEFNIYHDPEAAWIVFNSAIKIVMAPLEACDSGYIYLNECAEFKNGGIISKMVGDLLDFYCGYARQRGWDATAIFDALPIVWLLHPEYFMTELMNVDIEMNGIHTRGMTVCDRRRGIPLNRHPVEVMTAVNRDLFIKYIKDSINLLDKKIDNKNNLPI